MSDLVLDPEKTYAEMEPFTNIVARVFAGTTIPGRMMSPGRSIVEVPEGVSVRIGDRYNAGSFDRPTLESRRGEALAKLNDAFERAAGKLIAAFPPTERLTWPIQEAEALARQASPEAPTPYLDTLAAGRGKTTAELVERVAANSAAWRAASARLLAQRHNGEEAILAASDQTAIDDAYSAAVLALGSP